MDEVARRLELVYGWLNLPVIRWAAFHKATRVNAFTLR